MKRDEKFIYFKTLKDKLVLSGDIGSIKYYRIQIVAKYNNIELITVPHKNNIFKGIKLQGNDFELFDSNAIAFYLSTDQFKCSNNSFTFSEVLQWLSYADNHILPAVLGWVVPYLSKNIPNNIKTNIKTSKEDVLSSLQKLNNILLTKTYLVGERISLADISVFTTLMPLYEYVLDSEYRKQYTNLNRWFFTILNQSQVISVIKKFNICEKVKIGKY